MSDVKTRTGDATSGGPAIPRQRPRAPRVPVDRELFLRACAAKGARTEEDRATLLGTTAKMTYNYGYGYVEPGLTKARHIADLLGVEIDDLWPRTRNARVAA